MLLLLKNKKLVCEVFLPMTKHMAITKEVAARTTESTIGNNQAFDSGFGP